MRGFNLLLGDAAVLHYYSNRNGAPSARARCRRLRALSNQLLDSPWPKLLRSTRTVAALLAHGEVADRELFALLADRTPAEMRTCRAPGLPPDWERALSAPFVVHERYGTRCSTVLLIEHDGRTVMHERRFDRRRVQTGATRGSQFDGEAIRARDGSPGDGHDPAENQHAVGTRPFDTSPE